MTTPKANAPVTSREVSELDMGRTLRAQMPGLPFVAAALLGWSAGSMVARAPSLATPQAPLTRPGSRGRSGLRRAGTRNCREAARVSAGHPVAPPGRRPRTAPQRRSAGRVAGRVRGRRPRLEQTEANSAVGPSLGCPRRFDASPDRGSSGRFGGPAWVRIRSVANSSRDWLADLRGDPTDKVPVVV